MNFKKSQKDDLKRLLAIANGLVSKAVMLPGGNMYKVHADLVLPHYTSVDQLQDIIDRLTQFIDSGGISSLNPSKERDSNLEAKIGVEVLKVALSHHGGGFLNDMMDQELVYKVAAERWEDQNVYFK